MGLYSYPGETPPTPFRATVEDSAGLIAGRTRETIAFANDVRQDLDASVAGRRDGRAVTFLKTYLGLRPGYDVVSYAGEVSADGAEIDGRWTIEGKVSGPFLMIRAGDAAVYGAAVVSARA